MAFGQDGSQQHQRYELVSTLGRGGFAEVYLGWMHSVGGLRRKVAIKRILPELVQKQSQMFEQMFVDEARLAFQLEHENIVRVYDVGQSANTFFIVMEYVEGMDLKRIYETLVERQEPMSLSDSLFISAMMCQGLGYAHAIKGPDGGSLGLVHNDISPPNVLIGRNGEVKVADFGLSDARSNNVQTPDGMVKGKFAYISPEGTVDPSLVTYKSDIFSVGVVIWELIAGRRLFQRSTDIETFKAVRNHEVIDLRQVRNDVPPGLAEVVNKALSQRPEHRHESCEHLYLDLLNVSYEYRIPFHRYNLCRLVSRLLGDDWTGFAGTVLSGDEGKNVLTELESILPPGVADELKKFVTGAAVTEQESSGDLSAGEGWMDEVFDEVGLDAAGPASFNEPHKDAAPPAPSPMSAPSLPPSPSSPKLPSLDTPMSSTTAPLMHASSPAVQPIAAPPPIKLSTHDLAPVSSGRASDRGSPAIPSADMIPIDDAKAQRLNFMLWGGIGGLLLGAFLGLVIGKLL
jgi:serine/threonine protein kinase